MIKSVKTIFTIYSFTIYSALFLVACDGHNSSGAPDSTQLTITFEDVVRTTQQITRSDLQLSYEIRVNGEPALANNVDGAAAPVSVSVDAKRGDMLEYSITWRHKNFGVITASANDNFPILDNPTSVIPIYEYQRHNDDNDIYSNNEEIDQGYSPLVTEDSPSSQFLPKSSPRRQYVESRSWTRPVFACRNPPNGEGVVANEWIWIFNFDAARTISGVAPIGGLYQEFPNRGNWTALSGDELEIINEEGRGTRDEWTWSLEDRSSALSLNFVTEWGECVRIAGPPVR